MAKRKGYGYKQGKFHPKNPAKYKGSLPIMYRSSWEFKAMRYMDANNKILKWGSESVIINYKDASRNGTTHRYYVDLNFTITKNGIPQTYLVEIKPHKETRPPKRGKKSQKSFLNESLTWMRNKSKWEAAVQFCKRRGWVFLIWDEYSLQIDNPKK